VLRGPQITSKILVALLKPVLSCSIGILKYDVILQHENEALEQRPLQLYTASPKPLQTCGGCASQPPQKYFTPPGSPAWSRDQANMETRYSTNSYDIF